MFVTFDKYMVYNANLCKLMIIMQSLCPVIRWSTCSKKTSAADIFFAYFFARYCPKASDMHKRLMPSCLA